MEKLCIYPEQGAEVTAYERALNCLIFMLVDLLAGILCMFLPVIFGIHGDYECSGLLRDGDLAARDQSSRCSLYRMSGNGKEIKFLYDVTKHNHGCGNRNVYIPECRCWK